MVISELIDQLVLRTLQTACREEYLGGEKGIAGLRLNCQLETSRGRHVKGN